MLSQHMPVTPPQVKSEKCDNNYIPTLGEVSTIPHFDLLIVIRQIKLVSFIVSTNPTQLLFCQYCIIFLTANGPVKL